MFQDEDIDDADSYGWDNVLRLGAENVATALHNSDSVAFTAMAAKLLSMGYKIDRAGDLWRMAA